MGFRPFEASLGGAAKSRKGLPETWAGTSEQRERPLCREGKTDSGGEEVACGSPIHSCRLLSPPLPALDPISLRVPLWTPSLQPSLGFQRVLPGGRKWAEALVPGSL